MGLTVPPCGFHYFFVSSKSNDSTFAPIESRKALKERADEATAEVRRLGRELEVARMKKAVTKSEAAAADALANASPLVSGITEGLRPGNPFSDALMKIDDPGEAYLFVQKNRGAILAELFRPKPNDHG